MRLLFALVAMFALAQCASSEDERFQVGQSERALVIIGLAESADVAARQPYYEMLWRRLHPETGEMMSPDLGDDAFQALTNSDDTVRVTGLPGEFTIVEVNPGLYALDSIFAVLREGRVNYIAQGVITGPNRPGFTVRPGEAIYLGIWQARLEGHEAAVSLWRLDAQDLQQVRRAADVVNGAVTLRETHSVSAPCTPHRSSTLTQRQIC